MLILDGISIMYCRKVRLSCFITIFGLDTVGDVMLMMLFKLYTVFMLYNLFFIYLTFNLFKKLII